MKIFYVKSQPGSHIREKIKVVLDLTNDATKKESENALGVDTCDLAAKKKLVTLKTGVDKLNVIKLINFCNQFNNSKAKFDDLDVRKLFLQS